MLKDISAADFEREVIQSDLPTVVDFWAEWCGPCKMLSPVLASVAEKLDGKLKAVKVNSDDNQDLAVKMRVSAIPTLIFFKNGQEVDRVVGFLPEKELLAKAEQVIAG